MVKKRLTLKRQRIRLLSGNEGRQVVGGLPRDWTEYLPNQAWCTVIQPSNPCIGDPTDSVTLLAGCGSCDAGCTNSCTG